MDMMDISEIWEQLAWNRGGKIVYVILDGLGGLRDPHRGKTELQAARKPNLDEIAERSSCGLLEIVGPGITPGSGPGHLTLFGYHPLKYRIGRGIFSALGIDFPLQPGDVAARVNFATLDGDRQITDRRAGRIATELNRQLCQKIRENVCLDFEGEYFIETASEHRAVLVLRGTGLSADLEDTDPQYTGRTPLDPEAKSAEARVTANLVRSFVESVERVLADENPANGILLRGFDRYQPLPSLHERFKLRGVCVADYPMYRGVGRLLGMDVVSPPGGLKERFRVLEECYGEDYDFYFLHVKKTDSEGEDGDFDGKVRFIEEVDGLLPHVMALEPDVLAIAADHSTPAVMGRHSWHPVPVALQSRYTRTDDVFLFDEYACASGSLGRRPGMDLMGLALANAGRLRKFGA